jgi:hypothetical protein
MRPRETTNEGESKMKNFKQYKSLEQYANAIARRAGHGTATTIKRGRKTRVIDHVSCGHRKNTTGEYVPNAYLNNFGWKNTYYQHASTTVEIAAKEYDFLNNK